MPWSKEEAEKYKKRSGEYPPGYKELKLDKPPAKHYASQAEAAQAWLVEHGKKTEEQAMRELAGEKPEGVNEDPIQKWANIAEKRRSDLKENRVPIHNRIGKVVGSDTLMGANAIKKALAAAIDSLNRVSGPAENPAPEDIKETVEVGSKSPRLKKVAKEVLQKRKGLVF